MLQNEDERKEKTDHHSLKTEEGSASVETAYSDSVSRISSSIKQSYDTLRKTFDINQKFIVNSLHIEQNLEVLPNIAERLEKAVQQACEQRDEAVKKVRKERGRFYVGAVIGVFGVVVGAIVGTMGLLL